LWYYTDYHRNCLAQAVMAINLSRSVTRPCDILCDLTIDDVAISQATVTVSSSGVSLNFTGQQPSLKYNGQGYTCTGMVISAPSWHTIEDIRADAECVVIATNPKGGIVCMSVLLRTNTASSPINTSIHGWLPYAVAGNSIPVNMGDSWSLTKMIPPDPAYFTYKGSLPWSSDAKVQWVVFRTMGNIEPNDYALLTKLVPNIPPKFVPINQEIFFNETAHIAGVPDGKAYMRCKRIKKKGDETANRVTPASGLESSATKKADAVDAENSTWTWIKKVTIGYILEAGAGNIMEAIVFGVAIMAGAYAAYTISSGPRGLSLASSAQSNAKYLLRFWNSIVDRLSLLVPVFGVFRYSGTLN